MPELKKIIATSAEVILDAFLDSILPYKMLSKTSLKEKTVPYGIKLNHVFNQKIQRMQILDQLRDAGVDNPMKLKAWWSRGLNNFGDELLAYLLAHIAGVDCIYDRKKNMIAIGSIARFAQGHTHVWGSGIIRKDEFFASQPTCLAVRGPLTREKMLEHNIPCPEVYGDPAMLFPLIFKPKKIKIKPSPVIVPHFKHIDIMPRHKGYDYADLHVQSIYDIEDIITQIATAPYVLTSSLHGLIFCVAYGIPVAVFQLARQNIGGDNIKFDDFCYGVGLEPVTIHTINDRDESQIADLASKAQIYTPNWSPVPLLEGLHELCPTLTLSALIMELSSSTGAV